MNAAEESVVNALRGLGVPFDAFPINPEFADTAVFCEKYGYSPDQSANTIIVASKKEPKQYVACVVLATTRLDVNKTVTRRMGVSKASFATAEEMHSLTGMEVGGVTPFSLPQGVPLYVDARVMTHEWIILGGGGRGLKIKIAPEVLRQCGAEVVENLAIPLPHLDETPSAK